MALGCHDLRGERVFLGFPFVEFKQVGDTIALGLTATVRPHD
jgi:hypothetical protein